MHAEPDRDLYLLAAVEWAADRGVAGAAVLSRELAWCHLLFGTGKHAAALSRLRVVSRDAFGIPVPAGPPGTDPDAAQTLAAAADLLHRLRRLVNTRHAVA